MMTFHSVTPPICHGHLSSHNVFVDLENKEDNESNLQINVMIGDLESMPLLKYSNLFLDYRLCNVWSSPEVMKNPKKIIETTW